MRCPRWKKRSPGCRRDALEQRAGGQRGDQGQREDRDGKVFVRPEAQGHLRQRRRNGHQSDDAEYRADEGKSHTDAKGLHAFAFFHHRTAVEGGGDGGGRAGDFQEDGRNQATRGRADEQRHQQRQAGGRAHGVGQRQARAIAMVADSPGTAPKTMPPATRG